MEQLVLVREARLSLRPVPRIQSGNDEQAEQRRGDQAAQNDDRHRMDDLEARTSPEENEGEERQSRRRSRNQDRREPFLCSAQEEPGAKGLAFVVLEMLLVPDQRDAVACGNSEHHHQAGQRAERERAAADQPCELPAHQSERQGQEGQGSQAPASEGRL
jgi:hypothetical protein